MCCVLLSELDSFEDLSIRGSADIWFYFLKVNIWEIISMRP